MRSSLRALALSLLLSGTAQAAPPTLFSEPAAGAVQPATAGVVRSRAAQLADTLLAEGSAAENLTFNLFADAQFEVRRTGLKHNRLGTTWMGEVVGDSPGEVLLINDALGVTGVVRAAGRVFQIRPDGAGGQTITEADTRRYLDHPPGWAQLVQHPISTAQTTPPSRVTTTATPVDDGSLIDVMVIYTDDARRASSDIEAEIQLAVEETNLSYQNSGVPFSIRLVHTEEISYTETADLEVDLNKVTAGNSPFQSVAGLRDQYAADLVSLWVEDGGGGAGYLYCGLAWLMTTPSTPTPDLGYSVAVRGCTGISLTFAHELGHNMGAHHDPYVAGGEPGAWSYSHGHVNLSATSSRRWRTVMSYENACYDAGYSCSRVPYWSDPDIDYNSDATGTTGSEENARTLTDTAYMIANYRFGSEDAYEENDTRTYAYDLSSYPGTWLSAIAGVGWQWDDDWYRITVPTGEERVLVDLTFSHAKGNLNLALVNSSGGTVASSTSSTDNESIDYEVASAGTYYLRVYYSNVGNVYDLKWDTVAPPHPDLSITSIGTSATTFTPGASYTISATVTNVGGAVASSSTLRYLLSSDGTIDTGDSQLSTDSIPSLSIGASSAQSNVHTAPTTPGSYWVGVCVDAVSGERVTSNNCSDAMALYVPPGIPAAPTASDGPDTTGITVSWSAVADADSYQVVRCTTINTSSCSSALTTTSALSYKDTAASAGIYYYYRIKACAGAACSELSGYDRGYRPPSCSGTDLSLTSRTFFSGTNTTCTGTSSLTAGGSVTVQEGATATFSSPQIHLTPGFHAEEGATFHGGQ